AFSTLDRDGDGFIGSNDLLHIFQLLGKTITQGEVDSIITEATGGADRNSIDIADFCASVVASDMDPLSDANTRTIFEVLDPQSTGTFSLKFLAQLISKLGVDVSIEELSILAEYCGSTPVYEMPYEVFKQMCKYADDYHVEVLRRDRET
ncbi:hypothetical protein KIPB_010535, partial [Kipferlia bialata]